MFEFTPSKYANKKTLVGHITRQATGAKKVDYSNYSSKTKDKKPSIVKPKVLTEYQLNSLARLYYEDSPEDAMLYLKRRYNYINQAYKYEKMREFIEKHYDLDLENIRFLVNAIIDETEDKKTDKNSDYLSAAIWDESKKLELDIIADLHKTVVETARKYMIEISVKPKLDKKYSETGANTK